MARERLLAAQRQEHLLVELRRHGAVRVHELARDLGVSELTVRRDIGCLAEQGLVRKVHGGATLPARGASGSRPRTAATGFILGMVVPSLDFYWPPIVAGARAAAAALGATVQLRGSSYDPAEDYRQISRLVATEQVHGLLLAPDLTDDRADELVGWLSELSVPVVLIEREPQRWTPAGRRIESVRSDHSVGMQIAVHHLHQNGHRRIGLVLAPGSPTSAHLLHGWRTAAGSLGLAAALVVQESVALDVPADREVMRNVLRECRRAKATALIVHSDREAIAVARHCAERGIAVPGDLAIVSYDDELAELAEPALTAVRPPKGYVGRLAVELMVARLLGPEHRPPQRVLVTPDLIVRASSLARSPVR